MITSSVTLKTHQFHKLEGTKQITKLFDGRWRQSSLGALTERGSLYLLEGQFNTVRHFAILRRESIKTYIASVKGQIW
jgi:hypothetical protein